jgi:hypothetical protein
MKQKDLITIIFISVISAGFSFLIANFLFGNVAKNKLNAAYVTPIKSDFILPSSVYFNSNSIDLTQTITIGATPSSQANASK